MTKQLYFLGIGGTLMGNLAILAKEAGFEVSGFDQAIYPPMSDQLKNARVTVFDRFEISQMQPAPDLVVIGNASLPRGNPAVEYVLNQGLNYLSGAEWLGNEVLRGRQVIALSGTHGKTTTTAMVAWILHCAGLDPGFLIAGAPNNFDRSTSIGSGSHFVVEADEYDTSYFDRRSKFLHYRPQTLVINNVEFDHADIFENLEAIRTQFHHLIRAVPSEGNIIVPAKNPEIETILKRGCWSPVSRFALDTHNSTSIDHRGSKANQERLWTASNIARDGTSFDVNYDGETLGTVNWNQLGHHNVANGLAAIIAANTALVDPNEAISYLHDFKGVRRRLEVIANTDNLVVYSDFAHHPTAIRATLQAVRSHVGTERILAVIEPRTHTMGLGTHREDLKHCCLAADNVVWYRGGTIHWDLEELIEDCYVPTIVESNLDVVVDIVCEHHDRKTHVVVMSNGDFDGIFEKITRRLS